MAKSTEPAPTQFRQMYFSLAPHLADALKVQAATERKHMKVLLAEIITNYVEAKQNGKAKK